MADQKRLMENAPATVAAERDRQEKAEAAAKVEHIQAFQASARDTFDKLGKAIPGFTDSSGVLTDTAKAALSATVTLDPTALSPKDVACMAFAARSLPSMRKKMVELERENTALRGGKAPVVKGGEPPAKTKIEDSKDATGVGLIDRMAGKEFTFDSKGY